MTSSVDEVCMKEKSEFMHSNSDTCALISVLSKNEEALFSPAGPAEQQRGPGRLWHSVLYSLLGLMPAARVVSERWA